MTGPNYTPLVQSLPATVPFVGPEAQERQRGQYFRARIGANESVFGPSPRAVAAMQEAANDIWMYGDPESHDLRRALARHENVRPEHIIVGEGIDGLLGYLTRLVVAPGDAVVTSDGAYPTFNYHVVGYGGVLHKVPYHEDHEDLATLLTVAQETNAKLVYLANPDNPMGTWHSREVIESALDEIPEGALLVLDEAYSQFMPSSDVPNIDPEDPRVIRMRTFSKAYGMAGARVGYGIGHPKLISAFDKVRNHFGMNRIGQAGATASLGDPHFLARVVGEVRDSLCRIAEIASSNGLTTLPSAANFIAVDCGADGDFSRRVLAELVRRGIFVRMPFVAPQDRCIRISAGTERDLASLGVELPRALEAARGRS